MDRQRTIRVGGVIHTTILAGTLNVRGRLRDNPGGWEASIQMDLRCGVTMPAAFNWLRISTSGGLL